MLASKLLSLLLIGALQISEAFVPLHFCRNSLSATRDARLSRSSLMASNIALDPKETAIVLIEYQNEFTTPGGKLHDAVKECMKHTNMLENSRILTEKARQAGCSIIHCPISFEEVILINFVWQCFWFSQNLSQFFFFFGFHHLRYETQGHDEISDKPYGILANVKEGEAFTERSWGAEICSEMRPQPGDKVVKGKSGLCGFYSTNLDFILRQSQIKNVVLGGFLTNCCVESSMRTAYEHGYKVYTLEDCCAATSIAAHDNAFENDFGMFSIPTKSDVIIEAMQSPITVW